MRGLSNLRFKVVNFARHVGFWLCGVSGLGCVAYGLNCGFRLASFSHVCVGGRRARSLEYFECSRLALQYFLKAAAAIRLRMDCLIYSNCSRRNIRHHLFEILPAGWHKRCLACFGFSRATGIVFGRFQKIIPSYQVA